MCGGISSMSSALARRRTSPGDDQPGRLGPQDAVGRRHDQRGRHALVGDVADDDPELAVGQLEEVVEVAADLAGRPVVRGDVPAGQVGQLLRQELLLDQPGDVQLLLDPLAGEGLGLLLADQLRHADGRGGVGRQVLEQPAVVGGVLPLRPARAQAQHADQLARRHQRHDETDAGLPQGPDARRVQGDAVHRRPGPRCRPGSRAGGRRGSARCRSAPAAPAGARRVPRAATWAGRTCPDRRGAPAGRAQQRADRGPRSARAERSSGSPPRGGRVQADTPGRSRPDPAVRLSPVTPAIEAVRFLVIETAEAPSGARAGVASRHRSPPSTPELAMGDKSPHDAHHSTKSAKSIKEKRAERKAKEQMTESQMARLAAEAKHKH